MRRMGIEEVHSSREQLLHLVLLAHAADGG